MTENQMTVFKADLITQLEEMKKNTIDEYLDPSDAYLMPCKKCLETQVTKDKHGMRLCSYCSNKLVADGKLSHYQFKRGLQAAINLIK